MKIYYNEKAFKGRFKEIIKEISLKVDEYNNAVIKDFKSNLLSSTEYYKSVVGSYFETYAFWNLDKINFSDDINKDRKELETSLSDWLLCFDYTLIPCNEVEYCKIVLDFENFNDNNGNDILDLGNKAGSLGISMPR